MGNKHTGFGIALAWPQMYCKEVGVWYDKPARFLGINRNNFYKVGHAALVLVDLKDGSCHYFDFGRYHAPYQYGRVRMGDADPDLIINTKAVFSEDKMDILNFKEILEELQNNPACHGEGALHGAYHPIDYEAARSKAVEMHNEHIIPYGPFVMGGTNCSRFVNTVLRAGRLPWFKHFYLRYLKPITPTTLTNVHALGNKEVIPQRLEKPMFIPKVKPSKKFMKNTLEKPKRPPHLPPNAHWLAGEGAGSWFVLDFGNQKVKVKRYTAEGELEGESELPLAKGEMPQPEDPLNITYPSNLRVVTLEKGDQKIQFDKPVK
jgi:hypothetical protein